MNIKVGDTLVIHCYKHNGVIYESSKVAYVIDIKDDYIVLGDENVLITKQDGRRWHTKGSAIMFFYKKRWFNIIAQIISDGIFYYCNIASPFLIDDGALKYIDYDLDLRVFPDGSFKVLDRGEYKYHKSIMNYPETIDKILKEELTNLINLVRNKESAFEPGVVEKYCNLYNDIKKSKK
mgnify:CR=1 FL=1